VSDVIGPARIILKDDCCSGSLGDSSIGWRIKRLLRLIEQFLVPIQKAYDTGGKTTSSFELSTSKEGSNEALTDRPEFLAPDVCSVDPFREVAILDFLAVDISLQVPTVASLGRWSRFASMAAAVKTAPAPVIAEAVNLGRFTPGWDVDREQ
jgi:hypothetical protein